MVALPAPHDATPDEIFFFLSELLVFDFFKKSFTFVKIVRNKRNKVTFAA